MKYMFDGVWSAQENFYGWIGVHQTIYKKITSALKV